MNTTSQTIWSSLAAKTKKMADSALADIHSAEDWRAARNGRLKEFLQCLGLDPMPARCAAEVFECGEFRGRGFRARKIGFQILPQCFASATIYYPDPAPAEPAPGVLYVCGHAELGIHNYQAHPILWARRGYVCLILDTIEQSDNPGEHHGASLDRFELWLALGYTAAGGELWNSIRALDVLEDDPAVDSRRLAVTGVSGGGSLSFLLAVVDERIRAVSTLCGISTPLDAVANRHLHGHCDCLYPHNVFGRDLAEYAALLAPRAALLCFAEHDPLFHPDEVRDFYRRTAKVYELLGASDRLALEICPGQHGDHPAFDRATQSWFDRHVADRESPLLERGEQELDEATTSVFNGLTPVPNRLDLLPQLLSPRGGIPLPRTNEEWPLLRERARQAVRDCVFAQRLPADPPRFWREGDWRWAETPVREHSGIVDGLEVALRTVAPPASEPKLLLAVAGDGQNAHHAMAQAAGLVDRDRVAFAGFEPRWAADRSPARPASDAPPGSRIQPMRTSILRALALAGKTPVMLIVEDLLAVLDYLGEAEETAGRRVFLYGRGDPGVAALYAAALDSRIHGVIAEDIPSSHVEGAPVLGILRHLDLPQVAGLIFPRPVALVNPVYTFWTWPSRLYRRLGHPERFAIVGSHAAAGWQMLERADQTDA